MKFINIFLFIFFVSATLSKEWIIKPGLNAQDEIQEALILAEPGDKILLSKGTYDLNHGLSLDVNNIQLSEKGCTKLF